MPQERVARVEIEKNHTGGGLRSSAAPGAELFSLCQTASADGSLSARELEQLRAWLGCGHTAQMPAGDFIRGLLEQVVAAGRIGPGELQALARALEPSLPEELTRRWPAALRLVGYAQRPAPEATPLERQQNEILASACFMVCPGPRRPRRAPIARQLREGDPILLVRRPRGGPSPNAIAVCTGRGKPFGFIPELRARELAPLLDRGARYRAHLLSISAGEVAPVLLAQAFVYGSDATLGFEVAGNGRLPRRESRALWTALRLGIGIAIAAAVAAVLHS